MLIIQTCSDSVLVSSTRMSEPIYTLSPSPKGGVNYEAPWAGAIETSQTVCGGMLVNQS